MKNIRTCQSRFISFVHGLSLLWMALLLVSCGGGGSPATPPVDTQSPQITLTTPTNNLVTNQATQTIGGQINESATLTVNGQMLATDATFNFSKVVTLQEGVNSYTLQATDPAQNSATLNLTLTLDTQAPAPLDLNMLTIDNLVNGAATITGLAGSVEANATVTITNLKNGGTLSVNADGSGAFTTQFSAQSRDSLSFVVSDAAGNSASMVSALAGIPPDPKDIAPVLNKTIATTLYNATQFLYQGSSLIQAGLNAQTIDPRRAAVLRGKITDSSNNPLVGVVVSILRHPEFGSTVSRDDGMFDMVVNGGGNLTVQYQLQNYLPVQRKVTTPWKDYIWLPDVVMMPLDSQVTTVDLSANQAIQVARGSAVNDSDGTRQATILFPQGTQASMVMADGSTKSITTLNVRATEYTVGTNGPQSMPASLPPNSAYTYAIEFSVDEALAAGATQVNFSQPVPVYTENFLNFPVVQMSPWDITIQVSLFGFLQKMDA